MISLVPYLANGERGGAWVMARQHMKMPPHAGGNLFGNRRQQLSTGYNVSHAKKLGSSILVRS